MVKTLPTEASLGLTPTDDELATVSHAAEDDISREDDPVVEPPVAESDKAPVVEPEKPADPKTVDLRALQEARAEAREARQRATVLEQRWNDFLSGQQAPKVAQQEDVAPAIPDPDTDPVGAIKWAREQIIAANERQATDTRARSEQQQAQEAYARDFQRVDAAFTEAVKADPTVGEAFNAMLQSAVNEFLAMGYSEQQAQAQVQQLANQHVMHMARNNLDVPKYVKSLATARGWRPAAAQQAPKLDAAAIASTQQRHMSLSDAPGGEAVPPLDAKALAKMSDKEFKAWMSKKGNEARFDEIMGR